MAGEEVPDPWSTSDPWGGGVQADPADETEREHTAQRTPATDDQSRDVQGSGDSEARAAFGPWTREDWDSWQQHRDGRGSQDGGSDGGNHSADSNGASNWSGASWHSLGPLEPDVAGLRRLGTLALGSRACDSYLRPREHPRNTADYMDQLGPYYVGEGRAYSRDFDGPRYFLYDMDQIGPYYLGEGRACFRDYDMPRNSSYYMDLYSIDGSALEWVEPK